MKNLRLTSPRLSIRLLLKSDLQEMHALSSIPEVEKYNTLGIPEDISITKAILKDRIVDNKIKNARILTFAIEEKGTDKFIGMFGFSFKCTRYSSAEIWYKFHPDYWNKGLATEAVSCALDYCFDELKLHRVEAGCAIDNLGSIRVLEKAGMKHEGTHRESLPLESGWSDGHTFGILKTDKRN
ncbi:GNAT family N-acetyltransferase [Crocinitomicaceae bacterium]|nr:GNAT family N-acetyltransferase [Crocinitomicaceae bacterium]MDC1186614.1 GNAT family N-acetyltransferase [Crocinitomicaceae bacterium]MDG1347425.1 GNAT family protein [Crocinitomicaceae bacterium]MDG2465318.1 GNAT family protein [Crocinitomicaceae bacterium]